ncbi:hypothetical protein [Kitasatospora sp. KL5]|uniref:hypothetical protein n=1 Tax=Kitasatospora sp. KL5 TaxID=3425125 RepID=UPI003D6E1DB1
MADIKLNHANIDQAADDLERSSRDLHSAVDDCMTLVRNAQQDLQGDLKNAAADFHLQLSTLDGDMTRELNAAVAALREMHGLLRDADVRAGRTIAS